jgi:hypothetical protein
MPSGRKVFFRNQRSLFVLLMVVVCVSAVHARCVDSSEVNGFKVRNVRFKSLFGRTPDTLRQLLDSHRGEFYSAARASQYINEIVAYHDKDPAQQKLEQLIANKLKLSLKGGVTELHCVEPRSPDECKEALGDSSECVDVTIGRYFVEIDALNSSPYLLLFPKNAMTALYSAFPRPLLALNPALDIDRDRRFGPTLGVDTATDLLDLRKLFASTREPLTKTPKSTTGSVDDGLDISVPTSDTGPDDTFTTVAPKNDVQLLFKMVGKKSLNHDFYDATLNLNLAHRAALSRVQNLALEALFDFKHLPRGEDEFLRNAAGVRIHTDVRLKTPGVKILNLAGQYQWSDNRFLGRDGGFQRTTENSFTFHALADGNIARGLFRAAVWADGTNVDLNKDWYRRFLIRAGYGKEIAVTRRRRIHKIAPTELGLECWSAFAEEPKTNDQTIGLEAIAGAGKSWGDLPEHARFFAGRPPGQFLHDDLNAETTTSFPSGPIIRSLGRSQGTIRSLGGTSFWHANLNVAIPIRGWSRPLIPHEWVTASAVRPDDKEFFGHIPSGDLVCRDLKSVIKTLVGVSGINLMVNQQARDELTENEKRDLRLRGVEHRSPEEETRLQTAEALLSAAKTRVRPQIEEIFVHDILPVTNFIADHANIIAVKPLLMFDVASLNAQTGLGSVRRWSAGGGLQLDVVLARFEVGYLAALKRGDGDPKGSLVARLVLKRLF